MLKTDDPTPVILKLSSNKKSNIAVKGDKIWIQYVSQLDLLLIDDMCIDICAFRHDAQNKDKYSCKNGIVLKTCCSRAHTWTDHKRYSCTINRLQKMLDGKIDEMRMFGFTGRHGKTGNYRGGCSYDRRRRGHRATTQQLGCG